MHSEFSSREQATRSHGPRRHHRPTISVVLASSQPRGAFDNYVAPLLAQCIAARMELIVARSDSALQLGLLSRLHQQVRFVAAPPESSVGDLRTYGMRAATGDIVVILDDSSVEEQLVHNIAARFRGGEGHDSLILQNVEQGDAAGQRLRREALRVSAES